MHLGSPHLLALVSALGLALTLPASAQAQVTALAPSTDTAKAGTTTATPKAKAKRDAQAKGKDRARTATPAIPASTAPVGDTRVYKTSGGKEQTLELHFPPNHDAAKAKVPGMILFHGGSWAGGSLTQFRTVAHYFASRGIVAATANYRMLSGAEAKALPAGETRKRVCITDAKSAIRWMKQHAAELGIDPARIITGGGSAGGHISALATLNPGLNDPADASGFDTSVVAYLWFNPAFTADDAADREVDVLNFLRPDIAPAIAFFGTEDTWKKGWDAAYAKLKTLGNKSTELWLAQGQAHSFFNRPPWQNATIIEADRFLVRLGLLSGEPSYAAPAGGEKMSKAE